MTGFLGGWWSWRLSAWLLFWSVLVLLGIFLGLWQWERAADKRSYLARLDAAPTLTAPRETPPEGARLILRGHYLPEHTLLLDNRTLEGRLGVAVLTPLRSDDGRVWLVQRGFLATGPNRDSPAVETPTGEVHIEGRWQQAIEGPPLFGPNQEGDRLQRIDLDAWQQNLRFAHDGWLHLDTGAGLLETWWKPSVMPPSRHQGYAVQWWGLALTALVMMIIGGRKIFLARGGSPVQQVVNSRTQRLKLVALMALFAVPLLVAWGMVQWRVGIPEQRTAHGELAPQVPYLAEWPLHGPHDAIDDGDWILAFDCTQACEQVADRWWRLHRALGREAPRVTRLRIAAPGQAGESLAGEVIAEWRDVPAWQSPGRVWLADPRGEVVLSYAGEVELRDVMSDLSHLLRMNPEVRLETERDQT